MTDETHASRMARWLPSLLFWAGMVSFAFGFVYNRMWHAASLGSSQFVWLLLIAATVAWALKWLGGKWLGEHSMATAWLVVGLVGLAWFAGVGPVLEVMLVGLAAFGVGSLLVPTSWQARIPLSMVTGLALICGVDGWLLLFRMHYLLVYLAVFSLLVVWRRHAIVVMLRPLAGSWLDAVDGARRSAGFALVVVFAASTWAWLPTTMYDDLAYHLALPSQLAQLGYYRMDVGSSVWALSSWAADVLQAIVQVMAGTEARGAVDVLWFGLSCTLLWQLCKALSLSSAMRWLAVALFASLPLTMSMLHSMQTEGPTITVMLALAYVIATRPQPDARALMVVGVLFGLLIGIKVSNLWFAGPLGLWMLWRNRMTLAWKMLPWAVLLGVLVAGSSYAYAWALTGNPVLPLFNGFFHSPWFALTNFHDARWDTGLHAGLVWNLVFHRDRYMEGGPWGPAVLLALGGCLLVALTRRHARGLAWTGVACLLLPFFMIQYYRYAYPALALLIPAMLCVVPMAGAGARHRRGMWVALWVVVTTSLVMAGSSTWQMKSGALAKRIVSGKDATIARFAPMRQVLGAVHAQYGAAARVLILSQDVPFAAEMAGRALVVNWYDPTLAALADKARKSHAVDAWSILIERSGANVLVTRADNVGPGLRQAIQARHGQSMFATKRLIAWRLPAARAGHFAKLGAHAWQATFDVDHAPTGDTLGFAQVTLHCTRVASGLRQILVDWHVENTSHATANKREYVTCTNRGMARASVHFLTSSQVIGLQATVQPASNADANLQPMAAKASLRHDLSTQRDMAPRVYRWFGFGSGDEHPIRWIEP